MKANLLFQQEKIIDKIHVSLWRLEALLFSGLKSPSQSMQSKFQEKSQQLVQRITDYKKYLNTPKGQKIYNRWLKATADLEERGTNFLNELNDFYLLQKDIEQNIVSISGLIHYQLKSHIEKSDSHFQLKLDLLYEIDLCLWMSNSFVLYFANSDKSSLRQQYNRRATKIAHHIERYSGLDNSEEEKKILKKLSFQWRYTHKKMDSFMELNRKLNKDKILLEHQVKKVNDIIDFEVRGHINSGLKSIGID